MTVYSNKWERLDYATDRLRVPGGWLVRTMRDYSGSAVHMIFVADPTGEWVLKEGV